jgi:AcrR family transcriptional regulator
MTDTSQTPQGLRERNKERRRSTIVSCAYQLFSERGYSATTIADIAAAADIAPRTVSLYFPSKQDIVLDGVMTLLTPLSNAIDRIGPVDVILEELRIQLKSIQRLEIEHLPAKLKADPEIHGIITATVEQLQHNGVRALAREIGCQPNDPRVRTTLAALKGVVEHAMFAADDDEVDETIDIGREFLRAGIARFQETVGEQMNEEPADAGAKDT